MRRTSCAIITPIQLLGPPWYSGLDTPLETFPHVQAVRHTLHVYLSIHVLYCCRLHIVPLQILGFWLCTPIDTGYLHVLISGRQIKSWNVYIFKCFLHWNSMLTHSFIAMRLINQIKSDQLWTYDKCLNLIVI